MRKILAPALAAVLLPARASTPPGRPSPSAAAGTMLSAFLADDIRRPPGVDGLGQLP
jgi:hypothetical protein